MLSWSPLQPIARRGDLVSEAEARVVAPMMHPHARLCIERGGKQPVAMRVVVTASAAAARDLLIGLRATLLVTAAARQSASCLVVWAPHQARMLTVGWKVAVVVATAVVPM